MAPRNSPVDPAAAREIVNTRVLDASSESVFAAFSDPAQLALWWGPAGFTNTIHHFDFRPGGAWRYVMHGPNGVDYANESEFIEIARPHRVVLQHLKPMHSFRLAMSFSGEGTGTRVTWRMQFDSDSEYDRVKDFIPPANEQNLDRLAAHLSAKR